MRLLLTGGSGFIGSQILESCSDRSWDVRVIGRSPCGRFPFINFDLASNCNLSAALGDWTPEVLLHLAWSDIPDYSMQASLRNFNASMRLVQSALELGCKKVVLAGSCWQFGNVDGLVSESRSAVAPSIFAACKSAIFSVSEAAARLQSAKVIEGRIFYAYGPRQKAQSLVPSVVYALREEQQVQLKTAHLGLDFIEVSDVASALLLLCASPQANGVYNIGSGSQTPIKALVNLTAELLSRPRVFSDEQCTGGFWANVERLRALGWQPQFDLKVGLQRYLKSVAALS